MIRISELNLLCQWGWPHLRRPGSRCPGTRARRGRRRWGWCGARRSRWSAPSPLPGTRPPASGSASTGHTRQVRPVPAIRRSRGWNISRHYKSLDQGFIIQLLANSDILFLTLLQIYLWLDPDRAEGRDAVLWARGVPAPQRGHGALAPPGDGHGADLQPGDEDCAAVHGQAGAEARGRPLVRPHWESDNAGSPRDVRGRDWWLGLRRGEARVLRQPRRVGGGAEAVQLNRECDYLAPCRKQCQLHGQDVLRNCPNYHSVRSKPLIIIYIWEILILSVAGRIISAGSLSQYSRSPLQSGSVQPPAVPVLGHQVRCDEVTHHARHEPWLQQPASGHDRRLHCGPDRPDHLHLLPGHRHHHRGQAQEEGGGWGQEHYRGPGAIQKGAAHPPWLWGHPLLWHCSLLHQVLLMLLEVNVTAVSYLPLSSICHVSGIKVSRWTRLVKTVTRMIPPTSTRDQVNA